MKSNSHLYARIFRFKFDTLASTRRLSERWRTTKCLSSELVKRITAMKRIRNMELHLDDAWTAYLMMLENDGKNEAQLIQYALLPQWLRTVMTFRNTPRARELAWFNNPTLDSLVLWLFWETIDRDTIRLEGVQSQFREALLRILHAFVVAGYKYSSTYGPERHHHLPLCCGISPNDLGRWCPPPTSEIIHYSHRLQLCAPVPTPAAIMCLIVQSDSFRVPSNMPRLRDGVPRTRAQAVTEGYEGPTVADVEDYHLNTRIHTVQRLPLPFGLEDVSGDGGEDDGLNESCLGSAAWDQDWYRLVACRDPWLGDMSLRGPVFTPGTLSGQWAGTFLTGSFALLAPSANDESPAMSTRVSVRQWPLYWELQEHHCFLGDEVLPSGVDSNFGDDILNAWMPRGSKFSHTNDSLEVYDPNTRRTYCYRTIPPRTSAHQNTGNKNRPERDPDTPGMSHRWGIADEDVLESESETNLLAPETRTNAGPPIDDDDHYCDTVSHEMSGIADILITGKTGTPYGDAWGHFTIYGRVRPWDGLIVLLRVPTIASDQAMGKWIFKGYLHDRNFVGRWRETSTPVDEIGYEGGFAVYRTQKSVHSLQNTIH
ncbi:hypothetical protein D9613_008054 [Agrocybe pediades]|uniref:Uncharacterized protein n=1 Tax=Agrocybe pediades TaxID=84607 RepID=A0A8H4QMW8_9AGAR|nr:hypothetical protein D9613_008054 [Agrocybe pediades]